MAKLRFPAEISIDPAEINVGPEKESGTSRLLGYVETSWQ